MSATEGLPLALLLTCTPQGHQFEPVLYDCATGALDCPRCGGWTFTAELTEPTVDGVALAAATAHRRDRDLGEVSS